MKIETTIAPRKEGIVKLTTPSGASYVFAQDADGRLVADVAEQDVAWVLARRDFMPADDADFAAAERLMGAAASADDADFVDDGNVVGQVEDLDDDDPANMDAAPIEEPASVVAAAPAAPKVARKKA